MRTSRPEIPSQNALDGESWRAFLSEIVRDDPAEGARIAGYPLSASDSRQVRRWRAEGVQPSLWSADSFLIRHGQHIEFFFAFAEQLGRSPWARGRPPAWHEESWDEGPASRRARKPGPKSRSGRPVTKRDKAVAA